MPYFTFPFYDVTISEVNLIKLVKASKGETFEIVYGWRHQSDLKKILGKILLAAVLVYIWSQTKILKFSVLHKSFSLREHWINPKYNDTLATRKYSRFTQVKGRIDLAPLGLFFSLLYRCYPTVNPLKSMELNWHKISMPGFTGK